MESYNSLVKEHKQLVKLYKQLTESERAKYGNEIIRKIKDIEKQLKAITAKHS